VLGFCGGGESKKKKKGGGGGQILIKHIERKVTVCTKHRQGFILRRTDYCGPGDVTGYFAASLM